MILVPLAADDAPTLARLHAECFDTPWKEAEFRSLFAGPGVFGWGVPDAAFVVARAAAGEAEILTLATVPRARRRGHAHALVLAAAKDAAEAGAGDMFLEVASDNKPAIWLYAGLGFKEIAKRPRYYARKGGAADALVLRAKLPLGMANAPTVG